MKRIWFHLTVFTILIILFSYWIYFASPPTVVLAQQSTETPTLGLFITVITDEPQINVRLGPSSSIYPVVGTLLRGATAPALGRSQGGDWVQIERPDSITDSLPIIEDDTQRNWTQLAREFVADIQGKGTSGYPSFKDGWIYQEIVDAVRADRQWSEIAG